MHVHGSSINKAGPKGFLAQYWSAMSMVMERMICFGVMGMITASLHGFPRVSMKKVIFFMMK